MFGVKNFSSALSLDAVCRAPSLNHRHKTTWWRECFFLDDLLPRLDEVLDRGCLMAMLRCVWWRIRWRRWCIVSHCACDRLLRPYLLLKRLAEPEEFSTLDEEMCRFSPSILVEIGVPGTPPVEQFFHRGWWLVTTPMPLHFWP
jgi:hypothetical protein